MAGPVISVQSVGKCYAMNRRARGSARKALDEFLRLPLRLLPGASEHPRTVATEGDLWALRDVSFEVGQGEVLAIMGRNGAGKSVLFKILSRVTRPTRGRVEVRGSVAPLLEVGTAFHPDLTGRENIYLNGVILGMRRSEVHQRVTRIVDFSGVGPFLDTPIRQYSSGMRMRLAFAVAAHLDRDIFLLDEVLAVGDRDYRERCLNRLRELAWQGKSILFVSHGNEFQGLCTRAILLDNGQLVAAGTPAEMNREYAKLREENPSSAGVAGGMGNAR